MRVTPSKERRASRLYRRSMGAVKTAGRALEESESVEGVCYPACLSRTALISAAMRRRIVGRTYRTPSSSLETSMPVKLHCRACQIKTSVANWVVLRAYMRFEVGVFLRAVAIGAMQMLLIITIVNSVVVVSFEVFARQRVYWLLLTKQLQ